MATKYTHQFIQDLRGNNEVKNCQTPECHLYPYRPGKDGIDPEIYKGKEIYRDKFPNEIEYNYK